MEAIGRWRNRHEPKSLGELAEYTRTHYDFLRDAMGRRHGDDLSLALETGAMRSSLTQKLEREKVDPDTAVKKVKRLLVREGSSEEDAEDLAKFIVLQHLNLRFREE